MSKPVLRRSPEPGHTRVASCGALMLALLASLTSAPGRAEDAPAVTASSPAATATAGSATAGTPATAAPPPTPAGTATAGSATAGTPAAAAPPPTPAAAPPFLHGGLNLRTDLGVHPLRLDVGARLDALDFVLVLDPMFVTDGQMSSDLLVEWRNEGIAGIGGWRTTTIGAVDGIQFQQNLLLGFGLDFPKFGGPRPIGQWGLELALTLVKHGGGLPAEVISFQSGRHYIDLVNFAMFARFELGMSL